MTTRRQRHASSGGCCDPLPLAPLFACQGDASILRLRPISNGPRRRPAAKHHRPFGSTAYRQDPMPCASDGSTWLSPAPIMGLGTTTGSAEGRYSGGRSGPFSRPLPAPVLRVIQLGIYGYGRRFRREETGRGKADPEMLSRLARSSPNRGRAMILRQLNTIAGHFYWGVYHIYDRG